MGGSGATNAGVLIEAPPASPPRIGLLQAVARPTLDPKWVNGILFAPEQGTSSEVWWDCPEGAGTDPAEPKAVADNPDAVDYRPWTAVADDSCSTFGFESRDYIGRATRLMNASLERKVGFELWGGAVAQAAGFPNNYLASVAATDLGTVPGAYALGELQQYLATIQDGRGMIHCTVRTLNLWVALHLLRREGALWLDAMDNIVVASNGYDGSAPDGTPAPADGSTQYAYATGIVHYGQDSTRIVPGSFEEALDRTNNLVVFRTEAIVGAWWDNIAHGAVNVDLCNTCCTADGGGGG